MVKGEEVQRAEISDYTEGSRARRRIEVDTRSSKGRTTAYHGTP